MAEISDNNSLLGAEEINEASEGIIYSDLSTRGDLSPISINEAAQLYFKGQVSGPELKRFLDSNLTLKNRTAAVNSIGGQLRASNPVLQHGDISKRVYTNDVPFRFIFKNRARIPGPAKFNFKGSNGKTVNHIVLPVAPEIISWTDSNSLEEITTANGMNYLHGGPLPLETITLEGFFPHINSKQEIPSYISKDVLIHGLLQAKILRNKFITAMKFAQPLRFMITHPEDCGHVLCYRDVVVSEFNFEYRFGRGYDVHYNMTLRRWHPQKVRGTAVKPPSGGGGGGGTKPGGGGDDDNSNNPPPTNPSPDGTTKYTIKRGDTLWGIADRKLGDGRKWKKIFRLNKTILNKELKKRGQRFPNPDLIYPGTRIRIPRKG